MSKNIKLKDNMGEDHIYTGIEKISTGTLSSGRQTWIPKDEARDYADLIPYTATRNGTYRVAEEGERPSITQHDDGTVDVVVDADGFFTFTTEVTHSVYAGDNFTKNGIYDSQDKRKISGGPIVDGYGEFTVAVDPDLEPQITIRRSGIFKAESKEKEGYAKVIVKATEPWGAMPYQELEASKNGIYSADDTNAYGYEKINVSVPTPPQNGRWVKKEDITEEAPAEMKHIFGIIDKGMAHIFYDNKHLIYDLYTKELTEAASPRNFKAEEIGTFVTAVPICLMHGGKIHILGGYDSSITNSTKQHWTYEDTQGWKKLADLPDVPLSATEYKGEIWIRTVDGSLMRWRSGEWQLMKSFGTGYVGGQIIAHDNKIYFIGGAYNRETIVHELDISLYHPMMENTIRAGELDYGLVWPIAITHNGKIRIFSDRMPIKGHETFTDFSYSPKDGFRAYSQNEDYTHSESIFTAYDPNDRYEKFLGFSAKNCFVAEYNGKLNVFGMTKTAAGAIVGISRWELEEEE